MLTVRQRIDFDIRGAFLGDALETGERIDTINVHCTAATDTFTTASTECQGRINLVLDLDERVQNHRTTLLHVKRVSLKSRLVARLIRIPTIDGKFLNRGAVGASVRGGGRRMLFSRCGKSRSSCG